MDNRKEFEALAERYCSMTIEEIKEAWNGDGEYTMYDLTGFGEKLTCTLCIKCKRCDYDYVNCTLCAWVIFSKKICTDYPNRETYINIYNADTPEELLTAVHARGAYMKTLYEQNNG